MIKAFLFDNGGVMTAGGAGNELSERLASNLGVGEVEAWNLLKPAFTAYIKARITEPELWRIVENHYGKPISVDKRDIWNKWDSMRVQPEMFELVNNLKKSGYKVGMLSNVIPNTEKEIRKNGGYDPFEFLVLSCEVGWAKPETEIYDIAMKHLEGIKPEEVVFLDDQAVCLEPAKTMGMKTILVKSSNQAIRDVKELI
ncbi:MAG TPA: HAD family phosphatase [Candidatus Saccharimonadales bacterium]|nr:HAD family phosphatase [Candidatus Saccharimonadales bacterium]